MVLTEPLMVRVSVTLTVGDRVLVSLGLGLELRVAMPVVGKAEGVSVRERVGVAKFVVGWAEGDTVRDRV